MQVPGQLHRGDHLARHRDHLRLYVVLELVQSVPLRPHWLALHELELLGV